MEIFERCHKSLNWEAIQENQRKLVLTRSGRSLLRMIMSDKEIEALFRKVIEDGGPEIKREAFKTRYGRRILGGESAI